MCVARVPLKTSALNTGHKNMKSIEHYNRIKSLDARAAQALARPDSGERVYEKHYEKEVAQWHVANGSIQPRHSIQFNEVSEGTISPSSSCPGLLPIGSILVGPLPIGSTLVEPVSIAPALGSRVYFRANHDLLIQPEPLASNTIPVDLCNTSVTLVTTSIDAPFTASAIFTGENLLDNTPSSLVETLSSLPCSTPSATPTSLVEEEMKFWSEYNFDDEGDRGSLSVGRIVEAPKGTRFAMQKNLALLRRENAILRDSLVALQQQASLQEHKQAAQKQAAHQQVRYHQPINHESSRNHRPIFQQPQNQHASNGYRHPYMDPIQNENVQFPPPQVPGPGLFPTVQHPFRNMQPHIAPRIDSCEPPFLSLLPQFQSPSIAPVYGNTIYNYQAFDMSRLMGHQQF